MKPGPNVPCSRQIDCSLSDHATLFFMSPMVSQYLKDGTLAPADPLSAEFQKFFPNEDKHRSYEGYLRSMATNIYKTKDGRYSTMYTVSVLSRPNAGSDGSSLLQLITGLNRKYEPGFNTHRPRNTT